MNRADLLSCSEEEILQTARQLRVAYGLKRTLRYATERDQSMHSESVAEHIYALFFLAQYFLPLEDPDRTLDIQKLYSIILFHDFGEILHGDVPYHRKTKEHELQEQEDAKKVFALLPAELQQIGHISWSEYEEKRSPEAKFAHALDKIEPSFELLDAVSERTLKRLEFTYEAHIGKKREATEHFPVMRRFVETIANDLRSRDQFWPSA